MQNYETFVPILYRGRGTSIEYDNWKDLGSDGWGWTDLLPYFKKAENTAPPGKNEEEFGLIYDESCHGTEGNVGNGYNTYHYPQNSKSIISRPGNAILGTNRELPGRNAPTWNSASRRLMCGDSRGATLTMHSINHANQSRCDARVAYYDPIFGAGGKPRPNLVVMLETTVTKLVTSVVDGEVMVTGVEVCA
jgi:choline dehydrogenase